MKNLTFQPQQECVSDLLAQWKRTKTKHPEYTILSGWKYGYIAFGDDAKAVSELDLNTAILTAYDGEDILVFDKEDIVFVITELIKKSKRVAVSNNI